jgi:hypothetical protein
VGHSNSKRTAVELSRKFGKQVREKMLMEILEKKKERKKAASKRRRPDNKIVDV